MILVCLILASLVLVLGAWLFRLRRELRETTEAVRERQAWLHEGAPWGSRWVGLWDLQDVINELVIKYKKRRDAQRGYLEQIQATLGSIREAVFIIDGDNQVRLANEALRDLLKVKGDPVGRRLESLVRGTDFFEYVRAVKAGEQSGFFVLEVEIENQPCCFEITGSRLPERGDDAQRLSLFVLHDITKQTRLEKVRTEFVQNLSHELRTPVTVIRGFADTLIEDHEHLSPEERGRFLEKIQKNSLRLNQMLEELLTLSRLENNPGTLQFGRASFHKVVRDTAEVFRMRLEAKQRMTIKLTAADDQLWMDPMRMAQVLENLLENAIRHAQGFTELVVETERTSNGFVCRVRDNGKGIPKKDLPHLFERFYRVDKGRSRESGGTGLGLSIAKHIVQQHGGQIKAESRVGEGTSMIIELPLPDKQSERGGPPPETNFSVAKAPRKNADSAKQ